MEGYLHKRGRGKSISLYKPYARRYFVLDPKTLELAYYADESKKSYRGTVNVDKCDISEVSKGSSGKSFCFNVKCNIGLPHEEVITLAAPNDEQLVEWITTIEELGNVTVNWLRERPTLQDDTPEPENKQEEREVDGEDISENVKNERIICRAASSSQWVLQLCSLSYDFKELSFLTEKNSSANSPLETMKTVELHEAYIEPIEDFPSNVLVQSIEGISKRILVAAHKLFFMDDSNGKQCHTFAFTIAEESDNWLKSMKECGCDVRVVMGSSTQLPPKPPFPMTDDDYEMNDIDEDSVELQEPEPELEERENLWSTSMTDIDDDDDIGIVNNELPPAGQNNEPVSDVDEIDEATLWQNDNGFDDNGRGNMHPLSPANSQHENSSPSSLPSSNRETDSVHPQAYLFDLLDRAGSGEINLSEFMVGLRRKEEVAKALNLTSNSRQCDGSRQKCISVFNEIDEEQRGTINAKKFVNYMNRINHKKERQQQRMSSYEEDKDDVKFTTPSTTPASPSGSAQSSSRSNYYQKIARKIQGESNHKRNLSIAISSEKIPQFSNNGNVDSPANDDTNLFTETESADDFLAKFRAKNGMTPSTPAPRTYEEERKTTDQHNDMINHHSMGSEDPTSNDSLLLLNDLKFIVLEAVHPAKGISTRQRLRELFRDDITNTIDFSVVEKFFIDHDSNSSSGSSLNFSPYLRKGPCTWQSCNRFLRHYEESNKGIKSDFKVKIEITLPLSGYSCIITSPILNWIQKAARKIKALPLADMNLISLEQVIHIIQTQHCVDFMNQCSTLCLIEMSGAENYVQFLEDATRCMETHKNSKSQPRHEEMDDVDRSFMAADRDGDGNISRAEWRRLMAEREGIVHAANKDKQKLIEENTRLRRALNADSEFAYERLQLSGNRAENYERYLDVKNEEIAELKSELAACKRALDEKQFSVSNSGVTEEESQYPKMYELPEDNNPPPRHLDPPSPPQSVVSMSLSASVPHVSIPDHYSQYEAANQNSRSQQYVDRLLTSNLYGREETTSWMQSSPTHKKIELDNAELLVPPSLNETSRRQGHVHGTPSKYSSPSQNTPSSMQHPLRKALINNTKSLDLTPLALTSRSIGKQTPKQRTPHKSFKDHTTSSRSKKLPEHGTGLFSGVRSPGQWSNSQAHMELE